MLKRKSSTSSKLPVSAPADDILVLIEDIRAIPISDEGSSQSQHLETRYLDSVHKDLFFELGKKFRLDISSMFSKILTLREKHRFNIFLRVIKEKHGIRIMDSLIYLEERHIRFNQLLKYLDQENEFLLKKEASEISPKFKMSSNFLEAFLEFDE